MPFIPHTPVGGGLRPPYATSEAAYYGSYVYGNGVDVVQPRPTVVVHDHGHGHHAVVCKVPDAEVLERRLEAHEQSTEQLLDRFVRNQQDLLETLTYTQGTWREEEQSLTMLGEHVRTATNVVRSMAQDVKKTEVELKEKDAGIAQTGAAIRNLEGHYVHTVSDLRGRIARCDASISKVASEMRALNENIRLTDTLCHDDANKMMDRMQHVDNKNTEVSSRLDRVATESESMLNCSAENMRCRVRDLDSDSKCHLDQIRQDLHGIHVRASSELTNMETRMMSQLDTYMAAADIRLERLASEEREVCRNLLERLNGLEADHIEFGYRVGELQHELEHRLEDFAERVHREGTEEIARLSREMKEGFGAVNESVISMKAVVEGEQVLIGESFMKDLQQLRKMVVLV